MISYFCGDCRHVLPTLPERSVHCCVTSPPYWGLRDYGTGHWEGGTPGCAHDLGGKQQVPQSKHLAAAGSVDRSASGVATAVLRLG